MIKTYKKNYESDDLAIFAQFVQQIQANKNYTSGKISAFAHFVLKEIVDFLDVDFGGIWFIDESLEKLIPVWTYGHKTKQFKRGNFLSIKQYPQYFNTMLRFKCINAPDAMEHPGLQEFLDNYLIPNHVVSVLDTVILNGRTIVGVLSLESRNEKRTWTTSELAVVQGVCLLIGTVLLLSKKRALEDQNKKLHENYSKLEIALKNVIQLQHTTNRKFEKSLALNLNKKIAPLLTNLQKKLSIGDSDLSMLELYLKDLTSPSLQLEQELKSLTIQELKVIELIKNGKNSTEIAKTLKLSAQTIQTYKKNIRRKLKLQGKKINLQTYLQQFQMPE